MQLKNKKQNELIKDLRANWVLWLMLLPAILFFVLFKYTPMVGFIFAFKNYKISLGLLGSPWVGLKNFEFLVQSGILMNITKNTILYNLAFIFVSNTVQITLAIILSRLAARRLTKLYQSLMFLPYFVSYIIFAVLIYNIFNYETGSLNALLSRMNIGRVDVYLNPRLWKYILIGSHTWKWLGYGTVIYLAAITSIDPALYEASSIDGANVTQEIRFITIPLLIPTLIILVLLAVGRIMRGQFELFYQVIGDNGQLYKATDIIDTFVFRSLVKSFDISMGTAAGLYQSLFGFIIILFVNYLVRRNHEEYALF
jgi:putative aldouronate transport system permease protein